MAGFTLQIPIRGEIDRKMAEGVEREISEIHASDEVHIAINSHGGDAQAAIRIAQTLHAHRGHTMASVIGQCDSAAVMILASCRSRYAGACARFAMHSTSADIVPKVTGRPTAEVFRAEAERLEKIDESVRRFISLRIGCSIAELAVLEQGETVLDARQALELGLLTQVAGHPEWARERDDRRAVVAALRASTRATIAASKRPLTDRHKAKIAALFQPHNRPDEPLILGITHGALVRILEAR